MRALSFNACTRLSCLHWLQTPTQDCHACIGCRHRHKTVILVLGADTNRKFRWGRISEEELHGCHTASSCLRPTTTLAMGILMHI